MESEKEKVIKVEIVNKDNKKESEAGKYLIDTSKIILAVFVVDNIVSNKLINSTEMFIAGLVFSFVLFFVGNLLNKRG